MPDKKEHKKPIPILFTAGYGRSGSTITDLLLSQTKKVAVLGEIRHLFSRVMIDDELCNCSTPLQDCEHWKEVLADAFPNGYDQPELDRVHRRINRMAAWPALRFTWLRSMSFQADLNTYTEAFYAVFKAFRQKAGADLLVDSSKFPMHLMALLDRPDLFDVTTMLLVRDARAVANSWENPKVRPEIYWEERLMPEHSYIRSAVAWNLSNRLTLMTRRQNPNKFTVLRYEDLTSTPLECLNHLLELTEATKERADDTIFDVAKIKQYHKVAGNPLGLKGKRLEIKNDEKWRNKMSPRKQRIVKLICLPQMKKFNYL